MHDCPDPEVGSLSGDPQDLPEEEMAAIDTGSAGVAVDEIGYTFAKPSCQVLTSSSSRRNGLGRNRLHALEKTRRAARHHTTVVQHP